MDNAEAAEAPGEESAEALKEENELLRLQLIQAQGELEEYFLDNKKLKQELEKRLADIESLRKSISWKLTAPLRKAVDLVSGGKK